MLHRLILHYFCRARAGCRCQARRRRCCSRSGPSLITTNSVSVVGFLLRRADFGLASRSGGHKIPKPAGSSPAVLLASLLRLSTLRLPLFCFTKGRATLATGTGEVVLTR